MVSRDTNPQSIVVTGSASGMGACLVRRLRAQGANVIGVDRHTADVVADLGTEGGRDTAVTAVARSFGDTLTGVVTFAGLSGHSAAPGREIVSVDYFGTTRFLTGLLPHLKRPTAAVVIGSVGAVIGRGVSSALVDACLLDDAELACGIADGMGASDTYVSAKLAVARWARRHAPSPEWIGSGVNLNVISPGMIDTPMVAEARRTHRGNSVVDNMNVPAGRAGRPSEVSAVAEFLLGNSSRYLVGSVIVVDGGLEAAQRPDDWPSARRG
ncbi:SDR family oxidoreductase [Embleya sp. NPDC050493]|uniref:SDR family oxidoreductase n=1 Tax=Embleya sp. NPDC050493 TaxID=3363989 RepID=UPI0037B379CB